MWRDAAEELVTVTSGGARPRSGPAPDPNSLRSGARDWFTLPATGYQGDVPEWPLPDQTVRESDVWADHWRKPQAERWAADQMTWQVAFYVRRFVEAEASESSVALSTLVRQLADDLGLTSAGMARLRWRIGAVAPVPTPAALSTEPVVDLNSARSRLRK